MCKSYVEQMKQIEVVAAVIHDNHRVLATERVPAEWKTARGGGQGDAVVSPAERELARREGRAGWEFPGGKMEPGESPEEALKREIREELSTEISVDAFLCTVEHDYPAFHLTMHCYLCTLLAHSLRLNEHGSARWLSKEELGSLTWLPPDVLVVDKLLE